MSLFFWGIAGLENEIKKTLFLVALKLYMSCDCQNNKKKKTHYALWRWELGVFVVGKGSFIMQLCHILCDLMHLKHLRLHEWLSEWNQCRTQSTSPSWFWSVADKSLVVTWFCRWVADLAFPWILWPFSFKNVLQRGEYKTMNHELMEHRCVRPFSWLFFFIYFPSFSYKVQFPHTVLSLAGGTRGGRNKKKKKKI